MARRALHVRGVDDDRERRRRTPLGQRRRCLTGSDGGVGRGGRAAIRGAGDRMWRVSTRGGWASRRGGREQGAGTEF